MYLSVIIPFKNEERRLPGSLGILFDYLNEQDFVFEVILVDDGSTDSTVDKITRFTSLPNVKLISHEVNLGKGGAVKSGALSSCGAYVLVCDADLSTPISEFDKLRDYLYRGFDIVIGSRCLPDSIIERRQPVLRRIFARLGSVIIRRVLNIRQRDTQCGFKLYKSDVIKNLISYSKMNGFSYDYELLHLAVLFDYKIKEIGVRWSHSKPSTVSVLKDFPKSLIDVFRIYRNSKNLRKQ